MWIFLIFLSCVMLMCNFQHQCNSDRKTGYAIRQIRLGFAQKTHFLLKFSYLDTELPINNYLVMEYLPWRLIALRRHNINMRYIRDKAKLVATQMYYYVLAEHLIVWEILGIIQVLWLHWICVHFIFIRTEKHVKQVRHLEIRGAKVAVTNF